MHCLAKSVSILRCGKKTAKNWNQSKWEIKIYVTLILKRETRLHFSKYARRLYLQTIHFNSHKFNNCTFASINERKARKVRYRATCMVAKTKANGSDRKALLVVRSEARFDSSPKNVLDPNMLRSDRFRAFPSFYGQKYRAVWSCWSSLTRCCRY